MYISLKRNALIDDQNQFERSPRMVVQAQLEIEGRTLNFQQPQIFHKEKQNSIGNARDLPAQMEKPENNAMEANRDAASSCYSFKLR